MINRLMPPLSRTSFLVILAMMMAVLQPSATANEATTSGGISVFNEGGLSVTFGEGHITFVTTDNGPAKVTATTGDTQYAEIPLTINDTRAVGARGPYTISIKVFTLEMAETPYFIDVSNIAFTGVTGLPDGMKKGWIGDIGTVSSEGQETVVIDSGNTPPAGPHTVVVHVRLNVPAGTVPGTYSGSVKLTTSTVPSSE